MTAASIKIDGVQELRKTLRALPVEMRLRVLTPAMDKTINSVASAIRPLIPVDPKRRTGLHYKAVLTTKVVDFASSGSVVGYVGPESKMAPHAHLVERGTRPRFTNSKPVYRRIAVGIRVVLKKGKLVTKADKQKKSIGSVIKNKNKPQLYRGVMPAFHPLQRGVEQVQSNLGAMLSGLIASGIKREFTVAKLARGTA